MIRTALLAAALVLAPLASHAAPLYVHAGKLVDTLQGKVLTETS